MSLTLKLLTENKNLLSKTTSENLTIIKNNELLKDIKKDLLRIKKELPHSHYNLNQLIRKIDFGLLEKSKEPQFVNLFNNFDPEFLSKLRSQHPELTQADWRHCSMIKLGLSVKETSILFYKSPKAIEMIRYRLKKKLNLSRQKSLTKYLMNI